MLYYLSICCIKIGGSCISLHPNVSNSGDNDEVKQQKWLTCVKHYLNGDDTVLGFRGILTDG